MKKKIAFILRAILFLLFSVILIWCLKEYTIMASLDAFEYTLHWFGLVPVFLCFWVYLLHRTVLYLVYVCKVPSDETVSLFTRNRTKSQRILSVCLLALFAVSLANYAVLLCKDAFRSEMLLEKNTELSMSAMIIQTPNGEKRAVTAIAPRQVEYGPYYAISTSYATASLSNGKESEGTVQYVKAPFWIKNAIQDEMTNRVAQNRYWLDSEKAKNYPLLTKTTPEGEVLYFYNDERLKLRALFVSDESVLYIDETFQKPLTNVEEQIENYQSASIKTQGDGSAIRGRFSD